MVAEGRGPVVESFAGRSLITATNLDLQGVEGAQQILSKVTRRVEQIDARKNNLGPEGVVELFESLTDLLYGDETDEDEEPDAGDRNAGQWGLYSIILGEDLLGDNGLSAGLRYASEDRSLRWLSVAYGGIKMGKLFDVDNAAQDLNICDLDQLTLNYNPISVSGLAQFLQRLAPSKLRTLDLRGCIFEPAAVPFLAAFFSSPRCRSIESLDLSYNHFGYKGIVVLLDALMKHNFTLQQLELCYGGKEDMDEVERPAAEKGMPFHIRGRLAQPRGVKYFGTEFPTTTEMDEDIPDVEQEYLLDTMPMSRRAFLERNRNLYTRVGRSAVQLLPITRIVIHARPPVSAEEVEQLALAAAESRQRLLSRTRRCECDRLRTSATGKWVKVDNGISVWSQQQTTAKVPTSKRGPKGRKIMKAKDKNTTGNPKPKCRFCASFERPQPDLDPFPLLKLPRSLQLRVVRFSCDDETDLSDAQWDRLVGYASHPDSLAQRAAEFKAFFNGIEAGSRVYDFMMGEFVREWRGRLGLAGFEANTANLRYMKEMRRE
ncbi:hypothetical protein Q8F55_005807 [Vanrija albida]|uniref:Uncharacterized protein n=1 Tax=Vanrija albida TaxID=181172 RepID=A0ABR3Q2V3_9TREE